MDQTGVYHNTVWFYRKPANLEGVIYTPAWCYHLFFTQPWVKERGNKYFLCYKQPWSYIQVQYLGIMTRPAVNRQNPFSISCMQEQVKLQPLRIMHIIDPKSMVSYQYQAK